MTGECACSIIINKKKGLKKTSERQSIGTMCLFYYHK